MSVQKSAKKLTKKLAQKIGQKIALLSIATSLSVVASSPQAHALSSLNPTDLSKLTGPLVNSLIDTVAIAGDHRFYLPASPLGMALGFDFGIEVTAFKFSDDFNYAMKLAGIDTSKLPKYGAIPKFNIAKGLPLGIDASMSYIGLKGNRVIGAGLKWTFLRQKGPRPDLAVQGAYSESKIFFMETTTYSGDVLVSHRLTPIFEPYFGMGYQSGKGELKTSLTGPLGLSYNVASSSKVAKPRAFVGFPIKLLMLHITTMAEYSMAKMYEAGVKIGFAF